MRSTYPATRICHHSGRASAVGAAARRRMSEMFSPASVVSEVVRRVNALQSGAVETLSTKRHVREKPGTEGTGISDEGIRAREVSSASGRDKATKRNAQLETLREAKREAAKARKHKRKPRK